MKCPRAGELAVGLHFLQPFAQRSLPAVKTGRQGVAGELIGLGELAGEAADRAPADGVALHLKLDQLV